MNHLLVLSNQNKLQNRLEGQGRHHFRQDPKVPVNLVHLVGLAHQPVPVHPVNLVHLAVLGYLVGPVGQALLEDQLFLQDPAVLVNQSNRVHPVVQLVPKCLVYPRGLLALADQLRPMDPEGRLRRLAVPL